MSARTIKFFLFLPLSVSSSARHLGTSANGSEKNPEIVEIALSIPARRRRHRDQSAGGHCTFSDTRTMPAVQQPPPPPPRPPIDLPEVARSSLLPRSSAGSLFFFFRSIVLLPFPRLPPPPPLPLPRAFLSSAISFSLPRSASSATATRFRLTSEKPAARISDSSDDADKRRGLSRRSA